MLEKLRGLYAITDNALTPNETLIDQATQVLRSGVKVLQLRDKKNSDKDIKATCLKLQKLCDEHDAIFILNDKIDIAIELGLSGLHIGQSDYERIAQIRKDFKGILGISCYGDLSFAKKAQEMGADYVAFGSFFASKTKPNSKVVSMDVLSEAKKALKIPICAIGGIDAQNVSSLIEHNVDMICAINDIWTSEDIQKQVKKYTRFYKDEV